jgi:hypothetical protein
VTETLLSAPDPLFSITIVSANTLYGFASKTTDKRPNKIFLFNITIFRQEFTKSEAEDLIRQI